MPDEIAMSTSPLTPSAPIFNQDDRSCSFVVLSDRTGGARPGVFERAVNLTNVIRPDFAIQIGDCIEGYSTDSEALELQWSEFDAITANLEVPLFRIPGNHDVSNDVMRQIWLQRYGPLHYFFIHNDILFLMLDTQDPPHEYVARSADLKRFSPDSIGEFERWLSTTNVVDPATYESKHRAFLELLVDWDGTMPAAVSEEQISWAEQVISEHSSVSWTMIFMHVPIWQGEDHPALHRIRTALGGRPYSVFAGHAHSYRYSSIEGHDHIRLATTGGGWVRTPQAGNFDHLMVVNADSEGPRIANVLLDHVLGLDGKAVFGTDSF